MKDEYLAVAYFQQGVSNFLSEDFEEALANFNDALAMLRGNKFINYEQLGLKYKLYSCVVMFNRGLCHVYLLQKDLGMADLKAAAREKETAEHDVIDEAIQEGPEVRCESANSGLVDAQKIIGVHRLFCRRWNYLSAQRRQSQESQNKGLLRQGTPDLFNRRPKGLCRQL